MKRGPLRTRLFSVAFIVSLIAAWWFLAPQQIGGSTDYVITHGISMEPRFHTGDLAIVRPAGTYKVGDIVAYHSTLLRTVVLHRIHAINGNTYVFKGDNNNFLDPVDPTRAELIGKLWLHVPRGGALLSLVHTPAIAAVICALLATFLLFAFRQQQHRRRKRPRKGPPGPLHPGKPLVKTSPEQDVGRHIHFGALLTASAVAAAVFVVLGVVAFTRPATKTAVASTPYAQKVTFGYSASAPAGPVYPSGAVRTGDPIFVSVVRELGVRVDYHFVSAAGHNITGTEKILLRLTGESGWSDSSVLTPATHFSSDQTSTTVMLNMRQIQGLLTRVSSLTGMGGPYTISVVPKVQITGTIAGHPLNLSFVPAMNFQFAGSQLIAMRPSNTVSTVSTADSPAPIGSRTGLSATRTGTVGTSVAAPATVTFDGVSPHVSLLRWISLLGLVLSALAAGFFYLRKRGEPFEETFQIQSQYGHLIVPIIGGEDLGWPPVDVPNIKALVRLAESGQRLILHNRANNVDTYMVNDEGTVYRYQVRPAKVVWGEWSDPAAPIQAAA